MKVTELYEFRPICGIYKIENKETGRVYIGQSIHIIHRLASHTKDLSNGKHSNSGFLEDFLKCGLSVFTVEILEECAREELKERENFYISKCIDNTYNLIGVRGRVGGRFTKEPT